MEIGADHSVGSSASSTVDSSLNENFGDNLTNESEINFRETISENNSQTEDDVQKENSQAMNSVTSPIINSTHVETSKCETRSPESFASLDNKLHFITSNPSSVILDNQESVEERDILKTQADELCTAESNSVSHSVPEAPECQTLPSSEIEETENKTENSLSNENEASELPDLDSNNSSFESSDDQLTKSVLHPSDSNCTLTNNTVVNISDSVDELNIENETVQNETSDEIRSLSPKCVSTSVSSSSSIADSSSIVPSDDKVETSSVLVNSNETDPKLNSAKGETSTTQITCASATQKRKVSLSEYRMRMKENTSRYQSSTENNKKSVNTPAICATAISDVLPEQISLAPLPLFDTSIGSKSPPQTNKDVKQKKEFVKHELEEKDHSDDIEHRENLTDRLKREFGFDDDSEGPVQSLCSKSKSNAVVASNNSVLCAQPPPPPPPPRHPRPQMLMSGAKLPTPQFGYPVVPSYPRLQYMVNQIPSTPYMQAQQPLMTPLLQGIHALNPSVAPCGVRPPIVPFKPSITGSVLRPMTQEYASVNAQSFTTLVQQPPPPPPPQTVYPPHVYQPGLYK